MVDRDRLVGIVSIGDIVKHRLWEMEQESTALRDYIQSAYPALGAVDVIQARDPKGDITSPSATVRRYGVPAAAADWGTVSRRLLLAVSRISRRRPPAAVLRTRRQSLAQRAAEEPWPADPHQGASAAGSGRPEIRAHRDGMDRPRSRPQQPAE